MMIDLSGEPRLSMTAAAQLLGVHVATIWRWTRRGVRGRRLRTASIGGRRYVREYDLREFLRATDSESPPDQSDAATRAQSAGRELDQLIGKGKRAD